MITIQKNKSGPGLKRAIKELCGVDLSIRSVTDRDYAPSVEALSWHNENVFLASPV